MQIMTKTAVTVVLRRLPYSSVTADEAFQCALSAVGNDQSVSVVLAEGGVLLAQKEQQNEIIFTRLEDVLRNCLRKGVAIYVDGASLKKYRLGKDEIADGVMIADGAILAEILTRSTTLIVF